MITNYFYQGQLRNYLLQFAQIFSGLMVSTGVSECGEPELISVPITIGSHDRVVAAIAAGNTQNRPFSLPIMAANISGLALNTSRKGVGTIDNRVFLPSGGVYPDDLRTVTRVMPIPYVMSTELSIYASNTQQAHQILEQLLMLFDPCLQIQTNDAAFDWTKIAAVELTGISNEENYPPGTDKRVIQWNLTFDVPIYISAPADIRDSIVKKIIIKIGDSKGLLVNEFDEDGELVPFDSGYLYGTTVIDGTAP